LPLIAKRRRRQEHEMQEGEKGPVTLSPGWASPAAKQKQEGEEEEMEKADEEEG
jgi:hypothetical protein